MTTIPFPVLPFLVATLLISLNADPLSVTYRSELTHEDQTVWTMGTSTSPSGENIGYTARHLTLDGQAWMPVMGEYHFSRYDPSQWLRELRKIKSGGVDVVATYVFWNHHEEREGEWDWSGPRNLRRFVEAAAEADLLVILRIGPWCHGEARYGGLPDWIVEGDWQARSNDVAYLEKVEAWYAAIGGQVEGLMWKDGGPVIGTQLDNEYGGPSAHLLKLKEIAIAAGFDTPLYTRTGWPRLQDRMPFGEMIPLFGVYAEGFWNHSLEPMPGNYREGFHFSQVRTSSDIGSDQLGTTLSEDESDARRYPYLTCEVGGGMMNSYHRRVFIEPNDVLATTLVKFGSGGNLLGYYMYHGGWNPDGRYSTLQESLMTRYPNDMPVKNYDFQAPIGAAGTLRPHYHGLRQFHLFLRDYQLGVAHLETSLPDLRPTGVADTNTLRWSLRSDGHGGLLFFNNYERLQDLSTHEVQFRLAGLDSGDLVFPMEPVRIRDGAFGFWPFRMELAPGFEVEWVTAQPLCKVEDSEGDWHVFLRPTGQAAVELAIRNRDGLDLHLHNETSGSTTAKDGLMVCSNLKPGREAVVTLERKADGKRCHLILLTEEDANRMWKGSVAGRQTVVLGEAGLVFLDDSLEVRPTASGPLELLFLPALSAAVHVDGKMLATEQQGFWSKVEVPVKDSDFQVHPLAMEPLQEACTPREIPMDPFKSKVAMAPVDRDFEQAARWRLPIPPEAAMADGSEWVLELDYVGDVLRIAAKGELWMDDFYNGQRVEVPLRELAASHGCSLETLPGLELSILPLQPSAPIYWHPAVKSQFPQEALAPALRSATWKRWRPMQLTFQEGDDSNQQDFLQRVKHVGSLAGSSI
jgi:beta-galactosidase